MTSQLGAYALRAGLARLYTRMRTRTSSRADNHTHARTRKHAHTDQYVILLFHSNSGFVNASECYVIRILPVLLKCI
jgi:hypothetical protein